MNFLTLLAFITTFNSHETKIWAARLETERKYLSLLGLKTSC
jgi:hypothetical protein